MEGISLTKYRPGSDSTAADFEAFNLAWAENSQKSKGFFQDTWDGFKRDRRRHVTTKGAVGADGKVFEANGTGFDAEAAAQATASSPLARTLKGRHLQMIAIGGSIGRSYIALTTRAIELMYSFRDWPFCWFGKGAGGWGSSVAADRVRTDWDNVILYRSSIR